jgi:CRP-like cAMP-binding protein
MNSKIQDSFNLLENIIFLKKTPLFSSIATSELKAIASIVQEVEFDIGQEIVKENDIGDCVYIIKEGKVKIRKKTSDGRFIELAELSEKECFGEMALFDDDTRSASVYAQTKCTLIRITRNDLIEVIMDYPVIAIELLKIFTKRLKGANLKIESIAKLNSK